MYELYFAIEIGWVLEIVIHNNCVKAGKIIETPFDAIFSLIKTKMTKMKFNKNQN